MPSSTKSQSVSSNPTEVILDKMDMLEELVRNMKPGKLERSKAEVTDEMVDDAIAIYEARRDMSPREAMRRVLETYLR